jgi:hypothetical protein
MRAFSLVLSILAVIVIGCSSCAKYDETSVFKEAKVLSVNENILRGEMIGDFLTSASGSIANDVNILGITYEIGDSLFIHDIEISHAMLAYYSGIDTIPVQVCFHAWHGHRYKLIVRVQGYHVSDVYYNRENMDKMLDQEFINNEYKGNK